MEEEEEGSGCSVTLLLLVRTNQPWHGERGRGESWRA